MYVNNSEKFNNINGCCGSALHCSNFGINEKETSKLVVEKEDIPSIRFKFTDVVNVRKE